MMVNSSALDPNSCRPLSSHSGSHVLQPSGCPDNTGRLACHDGWDWPVLKLQSGLYLEPREVCRTRSPRAYSLGPNLA